MKNYIKEYLKIEVTDENVLILFCIYIYIKLLRVLIPNRLSLRECEELAII